MTIRPEVCREIIASTLRYRGEIEPSPGLVDAVLANITADPTKDIGAWCEQAENAIAALDEKIKSEQK